ncbi:Imm43 family immunity protein [Hymenobacter cellulosivorans]|uniref:Imm43 family immunity protein n=1 Tax=Hymenobacter cellulosivorans TaxID=2932249 RepID=A0ABY4FKE8_9BACT|nr:Imm43 family immunity protein [Hymenobacter cellulosivorans]UOQ55556.1 Imm43 family immunity protein [Hymenobacter cellulosivorans]
MLYVAYRPRESQDKIGLPTSIHRTFTEEFNEKKPMEGIYSGNWHRYNRLQNGVSVPEELRLPAKLFMVCKGLKRFIPDVYFDDLREWIVSTQFLSFLKEHRLLEGHYEESELTVLSTTKKPITDKSYHLLRFFRFDNELVDFEHTPKVISPKKPLTKHTPPMVYYSELLFHQDAQVPPMFILDDCSYWRSFFCSEEIKAAIEQEAFLGFNLYTITDFVQERLEREQRFVGPG